MEQFLRESRAAAELLKRESSKKNFDAEHSGHPSIAAMEKLSLERSRARVLPWSCPFWFTRDMRYDMEGQLGQGDSAIVYKAKERQKGQLLAIKIYKMNLEGEALDARLYEIMKEGRLMKYIRGGVSIAISK